MTALERASRCTQLSQSEGTLWTTWKALYLAQRLVMTPQHEGH
jgi:hypothetical protein